MSLLTGKPRSATVSTIESTSVFTLIRVDFQKLLTQHAEIFVALAKVLAYRLEDVTKQVGIDFVSLGKLNMDPPVLGLLPQPLMTLHKVVPSACTSNSVTLTMA